MTPEIVIDLMRQAILLLLVVVSIVIIPSVLVGLIVSVFQAATQINEQSLSFVPRLVVTFLTLILASSWIIQKMTDFTRSIYEMIPQMIS